MIILLLVNVIFCGFFGLWCDEPEPPAQQTILTQEMNGTTIKIKINSTDNHMFDLNKSTVKINDIVYKLEFSYLTAEYVDTEIQALSEECKSLGGNLVHVPNYVEKQFLFWKYRELAEPTLIMKCYDEYKNEIELSSPNTKDGM